MREKLKAALNEISEQHIAEAATGRKKRSAFLRIVSAAAVTAIVIGLFQIPKPIMAKAVSTPATPRISTRPYSKDYKNREEWREAWDSWQAEKDNRAEQTNTAISNLSSFFSQGSEVFLTNTTGTNAIWSPANACIGLAMLAEISSGESRQQILNLLGVESTDALHQQISAVWESVYTDNSKEICTMANSLWLEQDLHYDQTAMDALGHHYYASVYQGDLGSSRINRAIGTWLDKNTGGFLSTKGRIDLPKDSILSLYSTLYLQSKWVEPFRSSNNTRDIFHAPSGEKTATFMNKELAEMFYYWGDHFSAISLGLKNGSKMWFILPDEGITPTEVLSDGQYMEMVLEENYQNKKFMKVNLSVPKFDISAKQDLKEGLQDLGITNVFDPLGADFSAITASVPVWLSSVNQAARVQIDEEGVKAATYIELPVAGSPAPPDEIVDFILDRPFLFVISKANIPLFSGIVNEP